MAHHDDLLLLARQMVDRNPGTPVEAELRRAVSTAYYALFHLLIDKGTSRLVTLPALRPRVARTFEHKWMLQVCQEYVKATPAGPVSPGDYVLKGNTIPGALVTIASTFVDLQELRHTADYNLAHPLAHPEADTAIAQVEAAFKSFALVDAHPATDDFLTELWCRGMPKRQEFHVLAWW